MRQGTAVAGRYRLQERIGAGGMGEVWRATDDVLGRTVAVKVVLPALYADPDFGRRFLAEARAMASVHHPGVIAIHDFGETEDPDAGHHHGAGRVAYLVMEYVAGEPLSRTLARVGRLAPAATMALIGQAAQALQAVHNHGIVHRDIKPANIMVRPDGSVALADFGIAVLADATALTKPGTVLGTPSYLAPEQVLGQPASARSDVYALGLVAYECLTGGKPFVAEDPLAAALQRVHQPAPPLPPDVPPHIARVVSQALATDPAQRWQTAAELALAAGRAAGNAVSPSIVGGDAAGSNVAGDDVVGTGRPAAAAPGRRRRQAYILASAIVAVLLAGGVVMWGPWRSSTGDGIGASATTGPGPGGAESAAPPADGPGGDRPVPAGFVACGEVLCPETPTCWRGLVQQGDRPVPPAEEDCAMPHYWETFAATYLPEDVTTNRELTRLMERDDIAEVCSATAMAERSVDSARTEGWRREAWPVEANAYTVLVHCLAGSPDGESPGAAFGSR